MRCLREATESQRGSGTSMLFGCDCDLKTWRFSVLKVDNPVVRDWGSKCLHDSIVDSLSELKELYLKYTNSNSRLSKTCPWNLYVERSARHTASEIHPEAARLKYQYQTLSCNETQARRCVVLRRLPKSV